MSMQKIKILLAKAGLDPHDKGIKLLARSLRDQGGLEVVYTGLYRTIEEIVQQAVEEKVDVVGLSVHTGLQMTLFPALREHLDKAGAGQIMLIGGGVMPDEDRLNLRASGAVAEIFRYSQSTQEVIDWLLRCQENRPLDISKKGGVHMEETTKVTQEEMREKVKGLAKDNFRKGLNCSESVYLSLVEAGLVDFPAETVALTTVFGGGIGLTGGVCGALVAAAMGVSANHGRRNPAEGTMEEIIDRLYGNPGLYRFFNQLPYKFAEQFGSTQCAELNKDYPDWFQKDRFRKCMNIVVETAGLAVDFIYQGQREGYTQPFGVNMAGKV